MRSKVQGMLDLATQFPGLKIRIFSGLTPGNLAQLLQNPANGPGSVIIGAA
jgi:hypothetical protein